MFVTMVIAAVLVDLLFGGLGLIPHSRPTRSEVFGSIGVDYKLFANVLATGVFAALLAMTRRRGITDPVCGMKVDRAKAVRVESGGRELYFCGEGCARTFQAASHG
jgi:YHS domain-containing protein